MALWTGQAVAQDDEYLRIYNLIEQADSLSTNQPSAALPKYKEAQSALLNLQRSHRDWNAKVVAFRLNYVVEKIAAVSAKTSKSGGGPGASSSGSMAQVKLLEAGAEPRKALRLHPKAGDKQTAEMSMATAMETKIGDADTPAVKIPAMKMTMDVTVKSVSPEGDINYEMVVKEASVTDEADANPQVAATLKSSLGSLKGLSGTGIMSNRGLSKESDIKMPAGTDPKVAQLMEQMKDSFARFAIGFPEEAAGSGAKWEVKTTTKSQGMTINETATYELVSLDAEGLQGSVKRTVVQSAENQKIENAAMPGLKLNLNKMTGTGEGNVNFDLAKLMPLEAHLEGHSDMTMAMDAGGQKQTMDMKMDLTLQLGSK